MILNVCFSEIREQNKHEPRIESYCTTLAEMVSSSCHKHAVVWIINILFKRKSLSKIIKKQVSKTEKGQNRTVLYSTVVPKGYILELT